MMFVGGNTRRSDLGVAVALTAGLSGSGAELKEIPD